MAQTKGKKSVSTGKGKPTAAQIAVRRQLWGVGCLFLAFLYFLALFKVEGVVLLYLAKGTKGIIGIGFYLMPFVLTGCGIFLWLKNLKSLYLKLILSGLLPVVLGIIGHIFTQGSEISFKSISLLWTTGYNGKSGGVISGFFGALLSKAISPIGAGVVAILIFVVIAVFAYNINVESVFNKISQIKLPKPSPKPKKETYVEQTAEKQEVLPKTSLFGRRKIDIALDEGNKAVNPKNEDFEISPPNVLTPAQILKKQGESKNSNGGVEALPFEEEIEEDFLSENFEKQVDGLMLEAEKNSSSLPKMNINDNIGFNVVPENNDETGVLSDRYDAVKSKSSEPVEIPQMKEVGDISPSVLGGTKAMSKKAQEEDNNQKVAQEIEAMVNSYNEEAHEYLYPPVSLLKRSPPIQGDPEKEVRMLADRLVDTLLSFGVDSKVIGVTRGPTVTRYELVLQRGIKYSRVSNLSEDIALSLGAPSIRISTIPDKLAIGIEVPNSLQQMVTIRDIIDSSEFKNHKSKICFPVGKDIANKNIVGDIGKMPHMLIAGTTGSGKSVCINSILISLLFKASPEEVRLIMIDPKMIELGVYNGIPHLLIPVVTDPKKASGALNWAVSEMLRRYKLLSEMGVRDLASYNDEVESRGEGEKLPQIVIVIDELADLMFVAAREVEEAIARIAQMARAAGMHLIIATQRPSADIITGIMKANIPSRVAFAVASQIESRIILDTMGAEKLIGKGDMLYAPLGTPKPVRVQGCFITTGEVEAVVEFIKKTSKADYNEDIIEHIENAAENQGKGGSGNMSGGDSDDPLMNDAIQVVVESGQASTSMLQRRLKLGYSRASRLIDQMEERGIVGPFEGSKPRQVMISKSEWQEMVLRNNQK